MKNIPYYIPEVCDGHYCPMDCEAHCPWADIVAISDAKGIAGTNYYNAGIQDKGAMMTHILEDIMDDFIHANAGRIRSIILDDEIDGGDDEIDE